MLFKRGSTISAAEGGCQAEVGGTSTVSWVVLVLRTDARTQLPVRWLVLALRRVWARLQKLSCRSVH